MSRSSSRAPPSSWPIRRRLRTWRSWFVEIEHVGSTAVAGLAAKPIIDIQVGVASLDDSTRIVAAVEALGYVYVPEFERELPNRRFFRRASPTGITTHHVHVVERTDHEWWDRHIWFRDWLRTHPEDRDRGTAHFSPDMGELADRSARSERSLAQRRRRGGQGQSAASIGTSVLGRHGVAASTSAI